jgi:hypothetical protein
MEMICEDNNKCGYRGLAPGKVKTVGFRMAERTVAEEGFVDMGCTGR